MGRSVSPTTATQPHVNARPSTPHTCTHTHAHSSSLLLRNRCHAWVKYFALRLVIVGLRVSCPPRMHSHNRTPTPPPPHTHPPTSRLLLQNHCHHLVLAPHPSCLSLACPVCLGLTLTVACVADTQGCAAVRTIRHRQNRTGSRDRAPRQRAHVRPQRRGGVQRLCRRLRGEDPRYLPSRGVGVAVPGVHRRDRRDVPQAGGGQRAGGPCRRYSVGGHGRGDASGARRRYRRHQQAQCTGRGVAAAGSV